MSRGGLDLSQYRQGVQAEHAMKVAMTPFGEYLMMHDTKDMKKKYSEADITCECTALENKILQPLLHMESFVLEKEDIVKIRMKRGATEMKEEVDQSHPKKRTRK